MIDTEWLDKPGQVRQGEELDAARLEQYLRSVLPDASGTLQVEQFPAGFSNLTYMVRLGDREMVLRRPPFGSNVKTAHDMGREYRILSALIRVYPKVPRPLAYCEDLDVIGAPFYVMERVRGVVLRTPLPPGIVLKPDLMHDLCVSLIDTLVELHALDYAAAGLGDLGKPEGYPTRQIHGWIKRYQNSRTDDIASMDRVASWLADSIPGERGASLIHNDYRYDNVILDPADLTKIRAILDWEMSTLGDPLMDVGTTLAYWPEANDPPELQRFGLTSRPGNLDRRGFVEYYGQRSGRDVSGILFYYVYGLYKNAVIIQQIYYRYRQGHTQDPRFANLLRLVQGYADMALRAIEKGRIDSLH
ncbi:MAG: phosphotransferase family protein [Anaerolineae bacterium]